MTDREAELNQALAALEAVFLARLPEKLAEIAAANRILRDHSADQANHQRLHRCLHNLAGSAGTFGFHEVGSQARALEQRLKALVHGEVWTSDQFVQTADDVDAYLRLAQSFIPAQGA